MKFPDHDRNRIIGLASSNLNEKNKISGIKWIASYPENLKANLPRASASIILNDYQTGFAKAFIEGAIISASRTAASAVLATQCLVDKSQFYNFLFVGCGVISKTIIDFFIESDVNIRQIYLYDINPMAASDINQYIRKQYSMESIVLPTLCEGFEKADIISFATTEIHPYLSTHDMNFKVIKGKIILGISLRDLCPDVIYGSNNIVDDIDHCLRANTSAHLAEQTYGNRNFINGTIYDLIMGNMILDFNKPIIFSPFGLGILDLNVAKYIYDSVESSGLGLSCDFH